MLILINLTTLFEAQKKNAEILKNEDFGVVLLDIPVYC